MNLMLIVVTLVATSIVSPSDCLLYPTNKLFSPNLESICYDELLDSCGYNLDDLGKPGYQVYCLLCRGGVYTASSNKDLKKPRASLNFPNFYARIYGCFTEQKFIDCAYKTVYNKFKDEEFDLSDPGSDEFASLQHTLGQLYKRGKPYC